MKSIEEASKGQEREDRKGGLDFTGQPAPEEKSASGPKYPYVKVQLTGRDGNAFGILARVQREMRRAGVPPTEIEAFRVEAMSGDYDNLLATAMKWVDVS